MRAMFAIILSLFLVSNALSTQNDLQSVCARTDRNNKYVMKLFKESREVRLCNLASYQNQISGEKNRKDDGVLNGGLFGEEECESDSNYGGRPFWTVIADLNKDKHYDVILGLSSGGLWKGVLPHMILVNCGDDIFINVFYGDLATVKIKKTPRNARWLQLEAPVITLDRDGGNIVKTENYTLKFDEKKFAYVATKSGEIKGVEDAENPDITSTVMPNLVVPWGKFPSNLPPPITDDGTKEACKNARQLTNFVFSPRTNDKGQKYTNLCYVAAGSSDCIAPTKDQTDYMGMARIVWESINKNDSTGLYGWAGRFLFHNNDVNLFDIVAFSKNSTAEIHGFGVYINCAPYDVTGYLKVMEGSFTDLKHDKPDEKHLWADIHATRQCLNKSTGQRQSRTFVLKFDKSKFEYGPPNGDPALVTPCSDKEMSLPFKEVK